MCGIVGVLSFNGSPAADRELIEAMRDTMAHRGPDDTGIFLSPDKRIALGFRRLAILDVSSAGHQPMTDPSGRFTIVFNGEIYNFKELRQELGHRGFVFVSQSDTEVLLALYQAHGTAMLERLRGMFAFAIWDAREKKLFLARDRAGKKPLYWTRFQDKFIFASEIKAILKFPSLPCRVNEEAFYHFLSFQTTPAPMTLFEGIQKLPCGHSMMVDEGGVRTEEYWNVISAVKPQKGARLEDFVQPLVERLREAIRYRMVSDVPFGVFLSGGIDSTAIVALMAELMDRPVETFSVGYLDDARYSELSWARRAAERYGTRHHEVELTAQDMADMLPELVYHQDEPVADPVCVPVYAVAKLARRHGVIVCQVGEGADELFCGYPDWMRTLELYRQPPTFLRRLFPFLTGFGHRFSRWSQWERAARGEEIFWSGSEAFAETSKKRLLSERLRNRFKTFSSWEVLEPIWKRYQAESCWKHPVQWMAVSDLHLRLPELLLMRVDKMSMAHSVEARTPFLDHHFIEFVLGIDPEIRIAGGQTKAVLKAALASVLPAEIIQRPKQGFAVPLERWFWKALGKTALPAVERFTRETDYFDRAEAQIWMQKRNARAWHLANFVLWHNKWIGP